MKKLFLVLLLIFVLGCVKEVPKEEFCGSSTYNQCSVDNDCKVGGCSSQVCGAGNDFVTTCEYRDCYGAEQYDLKCKCVENKCQWS